MSYVFHSYKTLCLRIPIEAVFLVLENVGTKNKYHRREKKKKIKHEHRFAPETENV